MPFMSKERMLHIKPGSKSREFAAASQDAMAWRQDQERIRAACPADSARSARSAEGCGNLAVCPRFAKGNAPQLRPDSALKRRSPLCKRQIRLRIVSGKIGVKPAHTIKQQRAGYRWQRFLSACSSADHSNSFARSPDNKSSDRRKIIRIRDCVHTHSSFFQNTLTLCRPPCIIKSSYSCIFPEERHADAHIQYAISLR